MQQIVRKFLCIEKAHGQCSFQVKTQVYELRQGLQKSIGHVPSSANSSQRSSIRLFTMRQKVPQQVPIGQPYSFKT